LYPLRSPTARYGAEFARQFAPPLVGRAARLRPPSRAIGTHSSLSRAGLRPRPPSCPLEPPASANSAVGRSRAAREIRQVLSDCAPDKWWGLVPRLVRGSTLMRAQHSTLDKLAASTSLPVRLTQPSTSASSIVRLPRRRADRWLSLSLAAPTTAACGPHDCHARPGLPHRGWGESAEARRATTNAT
jgi:hypothetical protein